MKVRTLTTLGAVSAVALTIAACGKPAEEPVAVDTTAPPADTMTTTPPADTTVPPVTTPPATGSMATTPPPVDGTMTTTPPPADGTMPPADTTTSPPAK